MAGSRCDHESRHDHRIAASGAVLEVLQQSQVFQKSSHTDLDCHLQRDSSQVDRVSHPDHHCWLVEIGAAASDRWYLALDPYVANQHYDTNWKGLRLMEWVQNGAVVWPVWLCWRCGNLLSRDALCPHALHCEQVAF